MQNFIALAVILLIVGGSLRYIIKEKKKGVRCVGCSMAGTCAARAAGYACVTEDRKRHTSASEAEQKAQREV